MTRESKILIGVTVVVVGVMVGLFVAANRKSAAPSPVSNTAAVARASSHRLGSGSVQVVEFGDYQCPACEAAYPDTKRIISDYQGKITFIFRNYPLPMHPNAPMAAEAAEAAAAQGKFWEMHDKLYDTQNAWADLPNPLDTFVTYAGQLGLDTAKFKSDVQNKAYQSIISADQADGNALKLAGTPTFFVNNNMVNVQTSYYGDIKTAIDAALKK